MASQFCGIPQDGGSVVGGKTVIHPNVARSYKGNPCYIQVDDDFLFHDTSTTLRDSTELTCDTENIIKIIREICTLYLVAILNKARLGWSVYSFQYVHIPRLCLASSNKSIEPLVMKT